jgi:hypothetical protein
LDISPRKRITSELLVQEGRKEWLGLKEGSLKKKA